VNRARFFTSCFTARCRFERDGAQDGSVEETSEAAMLFAAVERAFDLEARLRTERPSPRSYDVLSHTHAVVRSWTRGLMSTKTAVTSLDLMTRRFDASDRQDGGAFP
jgi:hypothetical protein